MKLERINEISTKLQQMKKISDIKQLNLSEGEWQEFLLEIVKDYSTYSKAIEHIHAQQNILDANCLKIMLEVECIRCEDKDRIWDLLKKYGANITEEAINGFEKTTSSKGQGTQQSHILGLFRIYKKYFMKKPVAIHPDTTSIAALAAGATGSRSPVHFGDQKAQVIFTASQQDQKVYDSELQLVLQMSFDMTRSKPNPN